MPKFAPRYRHALLEAVYRLDDGKISIAELCRRVDTEAERLGLPRPSYVHLRRISQAERERRRERREVIVDGLHTLAAGRPPDVVEAVLELREIDERWR